jgi:hypothetical protein
VSPTVAIVAPVRAQDRAGAETAADGQPEPDEERFAHALAAAASESHRRRFAFFALMGAADATIVTGAVVAAYGASSKDRTMADGGVYVASAGAVLLAASVPFFSGSLDELEATYEAERTLRLRSPLARARAEREWRGIADLEQSLRRTFGWALILGGAAAVGLAVAEPLLGSGPTRVSPPSDVGPFIGLAVAGVGLASAGILTLSRAGAVEASLSPAPFVSVAPVRGGAALSMAWRF